MCLIFVGEIVGYFVGRVACPKRPINVINGVLFFKIARGTEKLITQDLLSFWKKAQKSNWVYFKKNSRDAEILLETRSLEKTLHARLHVLVKFSREGRFSELF